MSSKEKRSSILKKHEKVPSSVGRVSTVASVPSTFKSNRKIEFHRKKSIKEFVVGEDVDTIWGNSYEVSTDGSPSNELEDATLANSTCRSTTDEQNKENQSVNQHLPVDNSWRHNSLNAPNTSWDLSITIADDEKRKIRNETSAVFSHSLNTTERLLVEPYAEPKASSDKVKISLQVENNDVHAMDISPIKPNINPSPRKMIYTFPKQAMFVEINDIPDEKQAELKLKDASLTAHQREQPKSSIRPSWRTGTSVTGNQSLLGGCSYNVSETWNSHPHAMYQQCAETRVSGELANVSSDVDTTIALTNAMTKVLQSRSNESIQKATNMELDESTTTLPTNALARARPSFLPSNQRPVDESQDGLDRTPVNVKREENIPLPTDRTEGTQSADISSPVEGHSQRVSLSLDNLSILADMKQAVTDEENANKLRPLTENKHEDIPISFGLSSLSLNLRPSSPETPVVVKPRILRPTLPIGMLETAKDHSDTKKTDTKDEYDRIRAVKRTPGMVSSQKLKANSEDKKETDAASKKSLVPMDISMGIRRHTNKPSLASMHSRMTVDMVESPKQSQNNRATIYHSLDIDIDRTELQGQNTEKQSHRATVLHGEEMELTSHVHAAVQSSTNAARRTNFVEESVLEETARIHHSSEPTAERMKRGTVLGSMPIDESTDCPPCSPQTALNNYRKTVYPLDRMKEDASVIPVTNGPDRKTILCNESMILDVCPTPKATSGLESSISCVVYGRNVDELSIHATQGSNAVDMKFARPTIFQLESCDESAHVAPGRQTVMQEQNMIISEGATSGKTRKQRLTTHVAHAMEEDETSAVSCEKKNGTTPSLKDTRKSIFNSEEMELTLVKESNPKTLSERPNAGMECMDLYKTQVEESKGHVVQTHQQSRIPRLTTYLREDMQGVQHEESKPRYTIYEREDMDVTKLHRSTTTATDDYQADRSNVKLEEDKKKKSKPRFSIYEHEPMNATNVCEDYFDQGRNTMQNEYRSVCEIHSKSVRVGLIDMEIEQAVKQNEPKARITVAHTGCADVGEEMQNDVTNYNTFLEHHEMSHGTQLQGLSTIHQTDHLQDKAFNSTRLSKAYERENLSTSVIPSRMSSYRLEAMDESNVAGQTPSTDAVQIPFSEKKTSSNDRFDSPMQMSPMVGNCRDKTTLQHNSRKSTYHPEAMESTPTWQKKADADRKTCIESFGLRKSDLQRIALESDPVDMEGISVLESDPTDSKLEKYVTGTAQEANYFASCNTKHTKQPQESIMHAVAANKEKGLPNSRLSIYDPTAMVEETVAINTFRLKQEQTSALDRREGVTSKERKTNDCMDETIVPENIRVERDVRCTRQSLARVASIVKDSPVLYIAEHPPIIDQQQPNTQGTLYGTEETMELTTALSKVKKSVIEKRNRQTIHQPDDMNLTMVGKDTLTPPPCVQRKTIYNLGSMDETPPQIDFNVANNRGSLVEPVQQPIIAERRSHRRPRQTILISQDMDLEKEEEEQHGEGQQSFALAMLPRESTEDRVPRSASILPKRTFFQEPSIDAYSEVTKPGPEMVRQSSHTIDRKLVTRTDTSAFNAHEITDISLTTTTMEPEIPCIGNITGMMSMREITQPLALASFQEQSHSVSVICRVDGQAVGPSFVQEQHDLQTMAFVPTRQNGASDDEFYDAEDDAASELDLVVDPLSLTKSRHLTMKFIDVEHLEQTNCDTTAPAPGPTTTSKRVHAQVLGTPVINRAAEHEYDPLQMTHARQTLRMDVEQTPQSPIKKRPRTSCANPAPEETNITAKHPAEQPSPIEEVLIKEERQSLTNPDRASQTFIHDPSVFLMEEENLLDDESNLPCASLNEEPLPDTDDSFNQSSKPPGVITEQSYYKNFANLTIDTFDSYDEEQLTPAPDNVDEPIQHDTAAPEANDLVAECISVSDEDSLIVTPPKVPLSLAYNGGNRQTDEMLDSTIASKIMYQIRQKHPVVKHPCCGMQTECLCRLRTELQRHQEMSNLVWNRWCSKYQTIKQRIPKLSHQTASTDPQGDEEKPSVRVTFEEQIEELNWRLLRTQVDDDFFFVKGELSREDISRRRSRTISSGHYPETPSAVFLADNYRSYLSEQLYADNSPPSGAPMPRILRITQLIANKLSFDTGTRWLLDCSEDNDGMLLLRHRTLRSFVISIQLQPPRGKTRSVRNITESWRLERIQVRECMEEYVHSSKLLLAHVEFMRLAKETTERTLRSTYRTVADLMGLWHHFHELIQRVFDGVNRLVAIVRNNDAMLCYDAQMERFYVKKCVHRALDDEVNTLQIHFNWIESIGVSGVSFKWPKAEHNKLLPAGTNQHTTAPGNFMQGVGSNEKTGLMFLECLLWNVTKHYET